MAISTRVANHGLDIASHVTDFGELGSLHFKKRGIRELSEAACNFGFAHASGSDHDDVFGDHFFCKIGREFLAAHAISQRNRHGALGVFLPDDMLVQFRDNLTRGQFVESDLFFFSSSG